MNFFLLFSPIYPLTDSSTLSTQLCFLTEAGPGFKSQLFHLWLCDLALLFSLTIPLLHLFEPQFPVDQMKLIIAPSWCDSWPHDIREHSSMWEKIE